MQYCPRCGHLSGGAGSDNVVVRMTVGAPAVHEYDEAGGPVKMHGSWLVTGR